MDQPSLPKWALGVFASIDAGLGVPLELTGQLGVPTIHLHAPHGPQRSAEAAEQFKQRLKEHDVVCTAVFGGFEGESYADIPTVQQTVGLVPPQTRASRLAEMKQIADYAAALGVPVVGLHIGFIPHQRTDPQYPELVAATQELLTHCRSQAQRVHLETGQETAEGLLGFIQDVGQENLFINFDPANMILYGTGEPIEALQKVGPYVRSVHIKDAKWSKQPGKSWGQEVPPGQGDVDMLKYLQTLDTIGYSGPLTIEREIPHEPERQREEIRQTVELLNNLKAQLG